MTNAALARLQSTEDIEDRKQEETSDAVLVHVRFHPNAEIFSIGEKPETLSESEWFRRLLDVASQYYRVFAGGRGFFRIPRPRFEAILKGLPG